MSKHLCIIITLFAILGSFSSAVLGQTKTKLKTFDTPYYQINTDLDDDSAREAWIRMTKSYEEFKRRTSGFAGEAKVKLSVFFYTNQADYVQGGGKNGTAFSMTINTTGGGKFMLVTGEKPNEVIWHHIQQLTFGYYAFTSISMQMPGWANQGLCDYFGEAYFTGDGLQTGLIPPPRLTRVQKSIKEKDFKPLRDLINMTPQEWSGPPNVTNCDQAWSLVHFLINAEDGKYQKAWTQYMSQIASGKKGYDAWVAVFGNDFPAFQKKCEQWWLEQDEHTSQRTYQKAVVTIMTSYLARAISQGQKFDTPEAFFTAAENGELKRHREDWLPASLLKTGLENYKKVGTYTFDNPKTTQPKLICKTADDYTFTGSYKLNGQRVSTVTVDGTAKNGATTKASNK